MKKNFFKTIALMSLVVCCFSCNKENESPVVPPNNGESYLLVTNNGQINPNPTVANMRITYLPDLNSAAIDCSNFPTIEHANTSGLRFVYKDKWLFVRSNKRGDRGIQKYVLGNGKYKPKQA